MRRIALFPLLLSCAAPATQTAPAQSPPAYAGYPQASYPAAPPPSYPQQAQPYPTGQSYAPMPVQPSQPLSPPVQPVAPSQPSRPLLMPLIGTIAWQAEVRSVIAEDIAALSADNRARVQGIPLVFDPTLDINAYASCDAQGHPAVTGTEGLLETIDAISQTRATDELYGTRTYDAYTAAVIPVIAQPGIASPALPAGIIPAQYLADPRRWSRAHEWFDEIVAFTFGHELSHHYLGHTGCAYGAPAQFGGVAQALGALAGLNPLTHGFNQPLESAADASGAQNTLDAGVARSGSGALRWTEEGAYALLDFFAKLEQATGASDVAFLNSHPPSTLRMGWVRVAVGAWHLTHRG